MTWKNAFDLGPCTVKVADGLFSGWEWQGLLSKGQSATYLNRDGVTNVTVAVDANGGISLTFDAAAPMNRTYDVVVDLPAGAIGARVAGIHAANSGAPHFNPVSGIGFDSLGNFYAPMSPSTGDLWTPDPNQFPISGLLSFGLSAQPVAAA